MFALLLLCVSSMLQDPVAVEPVRRAHAHNDYEHKRPLLDALDAGFCSVEADIWLVEGQLLVAHSFLELKKDRTLESLYLDPLRKRAKENGGIIHKGGPPFSLLIDVKSDAKTTFAALNKVLENYADLFTIARNDMVEPGAVTVVISGNCDREAITTQKVRYCGIDGRPKDLTGKASPALIPWISASWSSEFKWNGRGAMPAEQRTKLKSFVEKAHQAGRKVRFWATPETPELWQELLAADVDLINTDKLQELRTFLLKEDKSRSK